MLVDNAEISLIKNILEFSHIIKNAIKNNDPHRLYLYLNDIAKNFHFLWNKGRENSDLRFIIKDNKDLTISRLVLLKFVQKIIRDIFMILSIDIKESM